MGEPEIQTGKCEPKNLAIEGAKRTMNWCILPLISMSRGTPHFLRPLLRIACCFVALIAAASAQTNPFDTPQAAEEGKALFQIHCTYCHGARGEGGRGADLTTGQYRQGGSDADLYNTIREGIPGTEMPAVRINDEEVAKIVAFVKRLSSSGLGEKASGDPTAGKSIYQGKGGCPACHAIGRDGGSLGPALDDVGRRRGLKYLQESLISPDADVAIRYRAIQVITKSGQTIAGTRLNEDDVSVQLRDQNDNSRSFLKANIKEIRRDKPSLMPAYGTVFSKKEMEDLVAYLSSLRGVE
jgi:putative heme-binding domain-containing protein